MNIKFVRIIKTNKDKFLQLKIKQRQNKNVSSFKETIKDGKEKDNKIEKYLRGIKYKNEYVGVVLLCFNKKPYSHKSDNYLPGALLDRLIIDKKYQGLGIGKSVVLQIIHYVKNLGYKKLYTTCVSGKNSPIDFYRKLGFKKTGRKLWKDEEELVKII